MNAPSVWEKAAPGVYIAPPAVDEALVRAAPVGVAGFVGFGRPRRGGWPLALTSEEQIDAALELPPWGGLGRALRGFFRSGGRRCLVSGLPWERAVGPAELVGGGRPGARAGLTALDAGDEVELLVCPELFLAPPGAAAPPLAQVVATHQALLRFCAGEGSRGGYFALLDAPPGLSAPQVQRWAGHLRRGGLGGYAALHYPWVTVDGGAGALVEAPPSPLVAGVLSRLSALPPGTPLSADRGPHLAAANHPLGEAIGAARALTRAEAGALLEVGINAVVPWPGRGLVLWGSRTLERGRERAPMSVRRVLSFVRRSLFSGTQWAVFEPSEPTLWLRLVAYTREFLERCWRAGLLSGERAEEAFAVRCDAGNNPRDQIDQGRLNIDVAVRPVRSLEYIVLHIHHDGARTSPTT